LSPPDHQQRARDLASRLAVGKIVLAVDARTGAVVLAGACNYRRITELGDIVGRRLRIERLRALRPTLDKMAHEELGLCSDQPLRQRRGHGQKRPMRSEE